MQNNLRDEEIMRSLGRIEEKLESLSDLPKRVSDLERWQSWLKGAWAVVVAIGSYIFLSGKKGS